jgi:hypothetical protein
MRLGERAWSKPPRNPYRWCPAVGIALRAHWDGPTMGPRRQLRDHQASLPLKSLIEMNTVANQQTSPLAAPPRDGPRRNDSGPALRRGLDISARVS